MERCLGCGDPCGDGFECNGGCDWCEQAAVTWDENGGHMCEACEGGAL
jgi:hypothetical protein